MASNPHCSKALASTLTVNLSTHHFLSSPLCWNLGILPDPSLSYDSIIKSLTKTTFLYPPMMLKPGFGSLIHYVQLLHFVPLTASPFLLASPLNPYKYLFFTFRATHNLVPPYLSDLLKTVHSSLLSQILKLSSCCPHPRLSTLSGTSLIIIVIIIIRKVG